MNIVTKLKQSGERGSCPEQLGFGTAFSDHMFTQQYTADNGWHDAEIGPFRDLTLHPASAVLHYGQEVFEGLKAYRREDGGINLFRPDQNAERFNRSARRMVMPEVAIEEHIDAIRQLVLVDEPWIPVGPGASLYIRPTLIADGALLGLGAASSYLHFIFTAPVGAYYAEGFNPVSVYVSENYRRAVKGGVGEAKTGGNYSASLFVSESAAKEGYSQVLWLDAVEGRYVEEVGAMNICFVYRDGTIATPELTGSILAGVTRDSVLKIAGSLGHDTIEKRLDVEEVVSDIKSGEITEVFGCGTAAVISPVGRLAYKGQDHLINNNESGPVATALYEKLTAIQYGLADDPFGWVQQIS